MIRALLNGTKTQTRRIVKPQPDYVNQDGSACAKAKIVQQFDWENDKLVQLDHVLGNPDQKLCDVIKCPYGQTGDRLWVRETVGLHEDWKYDELFRQTKYCAYAADAETADEKEGPWRPSIHMPRWASRITLEITNVRVERLQDISEEDAIAEGIESLGGASVNHYKNYLDNAHWWIDPRKSYKTLWDSIYGEGAWDKNPWCWCITFQRVE